MMSLRDEALGNGIWRHNRRRTKELPVITDSAAVVLFAIRSGVRLGQQIRKSYIDATKRRDLVLPLPKFFAEIDSNDQAQWFATGEGNELVGRSARLKGIIDKFSKPEALSDAEKTELKDFYTEFRTSFLAEKGLLPAKDENGWPTEIPAEEIIAWVTVRQWAKGTDPNPTTLHRMAGTFIEIGVDYFANMPGALHANSGWGTALQGFLQAMNGIDFAEEKLSDLPGRLLVATLETVAAQPGLLAGDAKAQEIIKVTAEGLSRNVAERLDQFAAGDLKGRNRVKDWAELTFRSVLASGGRLVLAQPERFLGVSDSKRGVLVTQVGNAVLDLVLDHPDQRLDRVFGREGLETVIKAALATVGEHPEILQFTDNKGLRILLAETAKELGDFDTLLTPDVLPELFRVVLERTGQNLDLLWPELKNKPDTNLVLVAAKATLSALTDPVPGQKWKLRFTRQHLLRVTDTVLDELVASPQWLLAKAGARSTTLENTLAAAMKVLALRGDERISPETGALILAEVVHAVVLRQEFIQRLPNEPQPLVVAVLDALLAAIFDKNLDGNAGWQLVRGPVITGVTQIALRQLSRSKLDPSVVDVLETVMTEEADALAKGELFTPASFEARLTVALHLV
jgi:hypothetical protein